MKHNTAYDISVRQEFGSSNRRRLIRQQTGLKPNAKFNYKVKISDRSLVRLSLTGKFKYSKHMYLLI